MADFYTSCDRNVYYNLDIYEVYQTRVVALSKCINKRTDFCYKFCPLL